MPLLPHIYPYGATFFITFRLDDSLPQSIVSVLKEELKEKKAKIIALKLEAKEQAKQIALLQRNMFGKYEHQLDKEPYGKCHLKMPSVAQIIYDKILKYDGIYYKVVSFCIMPNHVHMLLDTSIQMNDDSIDKPDGYVDVSSWMQLIKGGSSYEINKLLGRKGRLWSQESFDHWIRNEAYLHKTIQYITMNPKQASLNIDVYNSAPFMYHSKSSRL